MQIAVNSLNIDTFGFSVAFDIYARTITFDTTNLTTYNEVSGQGSLYVQGIAFSLVDEDGVELLTIDWNSPQLPTPATNKIYVYDASALNFAFLFQNYKIVGAIKDQNGTVYSTIPVYKKICQPTDFNESGYVSGVFQITPNCVDNLLTVKEATVLTLCNKSPLSVSKSGTLSYPTGTISPVAFTFTPFSNNVIYTGEYRLNCTTEATYDLLDDCYQIVTYLTNNVFPVTCANKMADLLCCISDLQRTKEKNCENAIGQRAAQQLDEVTIPLLSGLMKEINGQDASTEALFIKKQLNCNCGSSSQRQNEFTPINPASTSIVLIGVGGTNVTSSVSGNTKQYNIISNVYQVVKGDTGDSAFTITIDTSTQNTVKYKITFNYAVIAANVLTAIDNSDVLLNQLNSLITATSNIDLTNLNGKCVIDLSAVSYFLSKLVPSSAAVIKSILIGSTTYNAPASTLVSNTTAIETWLNGLSLGTYSASFSTSSAGAYANLLTNSNSNNPVSVVYTINGADVTVPFQRTNQSIISFLQAVVDYLCGLTALQVAIGNNLSLCVFDYNGNVVTTNYLTSVSQGAFNSGVSSAICNLANRINNLTGITCTKIQAIFQDYPNSNINRLYGNDGSLNCVAFTDQQIALSVIAAIGKYSNVKSAFCAIDCEVPATCPDVSNISINMSGSNIGIYVVTWGTAPSASQTVTVRYKLNSSSTWLVATNSLVILPNGNISGTSPYLIVSPSLGVAYDIQIVNNCGGTGFIKQFTTPTAGVYTGSFILDNVLYLICGNESATLYSDSPFGIGVILYTDFALTTPVTGYGYVSDVNTGKVYTVDNATGEVLTDTGSTCNTGTPNNFKLGSSTGSICASSDVVLYTDGTFAVGKTLYMDSSLTTPVTGYSYTVYNNIIFNLNTSTGVIGSSTGLACVSNATLTINYNAGEWIASLDNVLPFNLTLNAAVAKGGTSNSCASFTETDTLLSLSLVSGSLSASQENNFLTCASTYYRLDNYITVNTNPLTNGGTVVISGVTITVVILNTTCSPYSC